MSAKPRVILLLAGMVFPLASTAQLQNTGTVDALIKQGQVEYKLQQERIKSAAKERASPTVKAQPAPEKKPTFDLLTQRSGTLELKEYVDRLSFVGVFATNEQKKAEIYYKGTAIFYFEGDSLPRGFDLVEINDTNIKVRSRSNGNTQTLYMRSIASVEREKREFYEQKEQLNIPGQGRLR